MEKGLLLVFTGNSSTVRLPVIGQIVRALGSGLRISVFQFGGESVHEIEYLSQYYNATGILKTFSPNSSSVETLWKGAQLAARSEYAQMVCLLELSRLLEQGIADENEITEILATRPEALHVLIAGKHIPPSVLDISDLITEVNELRREKE
jgi:cob(I)alamin adenosyltransferase